MNNPQNAAYELPDWNDRARLQWYGERGIVNAIVTHIAAAPDFPATVRRLLEAILWADGGAPAWIQQMEDARLIIEIGLANFGNPDLIVVCKTDEAQPQVVFLEAKVRPYAFCCGDNSVPMGPVIIVRSTGSSR